MSHKELVPMVDILAEVLDESLQLSIGDMSRLCSIQRKVIIDMVQFGIVEPKGQGLNNWRFTGHDLVRVRQTLRLQNDLGINLPGAALVIDLLDELNELRARIRRNHTL
ncbi:chaperone modulator CbpM [Neptunomonas sp.]|uniref:chaperone modulator CbpM n=1 Tax=Neptunomonas sp. TaxID=1971898 RepID=UPI0035635AD2